MTMPPLPELGEPETLTDEQIMYHWGRRDECLHGSNAVIWFARAIVRCTAHKRKDAP